MVTISGVLRLFSNNNANNSGEERTGPVVTLAKGLTITKTKPTEERSQKIKVINVDASSKHKTLEFDQVGTKSIKH